MDANKKIKKEVSCRILTPYFYLLNQKGIALNSILTNIQYSIEYLSKRSERIEWTVYCKLMENMRKYFSPSDFEEVGYLHVKRGFYPEGVIAGFIFFSSNKFSRILTKQIFRIGQHMFSCIKNNVDYLENNHIRVKAYLTEGYEFVPEFFYLTKGAWQQLGKLIGHKDFKIIIEWIENGAVFDITWHKETIFFKLDRWLRWLFNIRKAFLDLTDSHEELLNQYNRLEESKRLLQKQTTQLKTAHDITKSIRQSKDIKNTLNAITHALVHDADFSFAKIKLFKDIELNNFAIDVASGLEEKNTSSIFQNIIINNNIIGELIVHPKIGIEQSEDKELLIFLQPIINITIHDSLVLRTVTDYKNNLEAKVETRTAELKKAQIQLSKTIHLLEETQQAQNRFFTNISHEFRTPLTLILGPAKQILESHKFETVKENAKLIQRSAKKLNRLANQLLDISRIESGNMKLKTSKQNLVTIIKEIVTAFQSFAERKNILLKLCSDEKEIFLYLDKDKIDKIFTNLLSNAFKFTPYGGCVEVKIKKSSIHNLVRSSNPVFKEESKSDFAEISIIDSGIGIPKEQIDKIFDRFYQVDHKLTKEFEGTGIGLSLTKELVELHKGKISVESEEGKGSVFTVLLPLGKKHILPEEITEDVSNEVATSDNKFIPQFEESSIVVGNYNHKLSLDAFDKHDKPILLIVEDNPDVRNFIINILENHYQILEACNGEDGLVKSIEQIPDLIISDIMMPKMDGFQLCGKLKNDHRTSHIPIILLTAKATIKDKIKGLERGADSYIMKPFEAEELRSRIKNLIEQRKRLHHHFQEHGLFDLDEKDVAPVDLKFLQKAYKLINEHLTDSHFDVENFAEGMSVSRSLLHKKLSALIGEPPGELIKRIRLNKAAKLIENKSGNVTEIAFEVGFNDPSYFAACFRKQFGKSPSQYYSSQ